MKSYRPILITLALAACGTPPDGVDITIGPDAPTTDEDLVVTVTGGEEGTFFRYEWQQDGAVVAELTSNVVPASHTAKGETWKVIVTPANARGDGPSAEAELSIANSLPSAEVSIAQETWASNADIVAVAEGFDADGDTVALTWTWTVDGGATEHSGPTVPAAETSTGQVWQVTVTPNDGEADGEAVTASTTIGNQAPVLAAVRISPDVVHTDTSVEAKVTGSDPDGDPVTYTYSWTVDGASVQEGAEATLSAEKFAKGQVLLVSVTPNDGATDGAPLASDPVTVRNSAPRISGVAISPSDLRAGVAATCTPSGWTDLDGDAEGYTFSWKVGGTEVATTAEIDGSQLGRGDTVSCTATPTDGADAGSPVTSAALKVKNTAPSITAAKLSTTSPKEADTISVAVEGASDVDGDTISYTYAWTVNGKLAGAEATLDGASFKKGDKITVDVTPRDDADAGLAVRSDIATAVNTAPVVDAVVLEPDPVFTDGVITSKVTASDADGELPKLSYQWSVAGAPVSATSATLGGAFFKKGQAVTVTVTPADGDGSGAPKTSSALVVSNTPPTTPELTLPEEPHQSEDVVCKITKGSTDADGDTVSYHFDWEVDGDAYTGALGKSVHEGDTLPAAATAGDEDWTCIVTPDDGEDTGTPAEETVFVLSRELPIDSHTAPGGQTVYKFARRPLPPGNASTWYQKVCEDAGMRPVSCDYNYWGSGYNASAWNAVILERSYWSCNVSSGIQNRTGWTNIITFHVPLSDNRGVCEMGCTITGQDIYPICTK